MVNKSKPKVEHMKLLQECVYTRYTFLNVRCRNEYAKETASQGNTCIGQGCGFTLSHQPFVVLLQPGITLEITVSQVVQGRCPDICV